MCTRTRIRVSRHITATVTVMVTHYLVYRQSTTASRTNSSSMLRTARRHRSRSTLRTPLRPLHRRVRTRSRPQTLATVRHRTSVDAKRHRAPPRSHRASHHDTARIIATTATQVALASVWQNDDKVSLDHLWLF